MAEEVEMEDLEKDESKRGLLGDKDVLNEPGYEEREILTSSITEDIAVPIEKEDETYGQGDGILQGTETRFSVTADTLRLEDRQEFENNMDETLEAGDLHDINDCITPLTLTKCATNSLEKSFEVSYKLKRLANAKGPDAEDLESLATSVENFALQLLEPLKSDDLKRAIFEGEEFDRVSDKAVKYRQKKFVSHPVVYNLLMRRRWTGAHFYYLRRHSNVKRNLLKWVLINIWTLFDVFLFPVAYGLLWVVHLITRTVKKRQGLRVFFLFNASWKYAAKQFQTMRSISSYIMNNLHSDRVEYATITRDHNGPIISMFTSSDEAMKEMNSNMDVEYPIYEKRDGTVFLEYLKEAEKLFKETCKGRHKVLVVMTDDKFGAPSNKLLKAVKSLRQQQIQVISVGLGKHVVIKELETMVTNDEDVTLILKDQSDADQTKKFKRILKCISGKDVFDHYVKYFTTPYFIFFRDTLTYLVLLGLHFAMCLQPSTIHFTAIEGIIMLFFLGRLMMEINQVVMERNSERTERNEEFEEKSHHKPKNNSKKIQNELLRAISNYFDDWWNRLDLVTLIVFLALVGLRVFSWSEYATIPKNRLLAVAGYLYGLNAMFLTLRVFGHIMESKKSTGSIQIALFQIIGAVTAVFGQILAAILAFSLAITKIYMAEVSYNSGANATSSGMCENLTSIDCWWSSTNHLAWSVIGLPDLSLLKSSDSASDILAKALYSVFLIMGVVMLMNMMIALLSNTYQHVEDNAFYEWSYKKAITIRTYSRYHPVPVPFNIISLSFKLLRHIYRTIRCTECQRKKPCHKSMRYQDEEKEASEYKYLIDKLEVEYFAKYGYTFPMADDNKIDRLLKETEGSHQLIGQIAQRVFRYDQREKQRLEPHGHPDWDTKGIDIAGQTLVHVPCKCVSCIFSGEGRVHGAKYLNPLSEEYPGFEVLIRESGERRFVAIGVVTRNHEIHRFPGWAGNSAGYHIDDGRIFDSDDPRKGRHGEDAMAYRGDLIGSKILFDEHKNNKLPVSFTLNGRVIGQANLTYYKGFTSSSFYPFVSIGCEGISVLFRMCPKVTLSRMDDEPVFRALMEISERLQMINEKQGKLEWKIEHLSRP